MARTQHAPRTVVPRTQILQRPGLARTLTRVVTVDLYDNEAANGSGPLHRANGVTVAGGRPVWWYVTDGDARRFGWIGADQ